jgi:omega-6 fatty acid desaturase (delta-12 desaturase)
LEPTVAAAFPSTFTRSGGQLEQTNAAVSAPGAPADHSAPVHRARDWIERLHRYRKPDHARSVLEIAVTAVPFALLWVAAWGALSIGYWLTLFIAVPAAAFLVRLFMIQHDCGHGAFFRKRAANDWTGRVIGVLTLTPYDAWRRSHAIHHASSGNLDQRGVGDIETLTVSEFRALSRWRRLAYRLYRNPLVLFGIAPAYLFLVQNRLPVGLMRAGWMPWLSALGTNAALGVLITAMILLVGAGPFLSVHMPIVLVASSIGVWLFYVQHQFEETFWAEGRHWNVHEAALYGSSYYDLPRVLAWVTANIGVHHVHHLYSRIPYYRLPQVLTDYPALARVRRITLLQSFKCVRLALWDDGRRRLVSFREARGAR